MTVVLDPDLHKEIRHLAVDLGTSFQQLAVQALKEFLHRHRAKVRRR
jgi:predicted transcriptional regulator